MFEEIGDTAIAAIEVLDIGSAAATELGPGADFGPYFAFTGDRYPGELGNCGGQLKAGEMCTVHVVFTPTTLGPVQDTLVLAYEAGSQGTARLTLLAEGRGMTPSLVEDPGFEACVADSEPDRWKQAEQHRNVQVRHRLAMEIQVAPVSRVPPALPAMSVGRPRWAWEFPSSISLDKNTIESSCSDVPSPSGIAASWSTRYVNCSISQRPIFSSIAKLAGSLP